MDIRAMRYFLAIADTENVSKAAEKLHMSQPPLTRQMKQLEEELNVELFERESGRLHLTEAGYYFRERAREIVELTDKLEEEMKSTFGTYDGNISIGSIETVGVSVLPTWITEFHSQFPEITYNICYSNTEEILRKLDLGIFDVGIVREPFNSEKYECIRLREESWIACIHKDNPLSAGDADTLELAELAKENLIAPGRNSHEEQIKNWFHMIGMKPHIVCLYTALGGGFELVRQGLGILLCPKSAASRLQTPDIVCKEIINPKFTSCAVVVWKKYGALSSSASRFADYLKTKIE